MILQADVSYGTAGAMFFELVVHVRDEFVAWKWDRVKFSWLRVGILLIGHRMIKDVIGALNIQ